MSSKNLEKLRTTLTVEDQAYQAAVNDFDDAAAATLGVNRTDLRCLEILLHQDAVLPSRLATILGLTTGSVTAMLDRLEAQGYLTRTPDPADRRKVIVRSTPKATQDVLVGIYQPLAQEGMDGISHYTAEQLTTITEFLRFARQLHQRHLDRLRDAFPGKPRSRQSR